MIFQHPCSRCGGGTYNKGHCDDCIDLLGVDVEGLYHSVRWTKLSKRLRAEAGRCQRCYIRPPEEVHHMVPALERPDLFFEPSNLIVLCKGCHVEVKGG